MKLIENTEFGGERPLFGEKDIKLVNVTIHAGESALKCCANVDAEHCTFKGKYLFWHVDGFKVKGCTFTEGARAALWYSNGLEMSDTEVMAPKMFREMDGIKLRGVNIPDAQETLWHCRNIDIDGVKVAHADYIFMHCDNIRIRNYRQDGNYSFQYCRNVDIADAVINSKDAFWNTENVTVRDSVLSGEYLGWHSKNLHLINCRISGTQPLCYAEGLVLENCVFEPDCDLAFEDSEVEATIASSVTSIKNPRSGHIKVQAVGEIILDEHQLAPADCKIVTE